MLQPDPRSGEGCNTLLHKGFANVNTRKTLLYRHCYKPSFLVQVFTIQSKNTLSKFLTKGLTSINTRLGRASIALKPAMDIDVYITITEQPFEITRRGLQRPLIHGCRGLQSHWSPLQTSSDVHFRYDKQEVSIDCQRLQHV